MKFLYDFYAQEIYGKSNKELSQVERGAVKERVKQDVKKQTKLLKSGTVYMDASAAAYHENVKYLVNLLVKGDPERAFTGGIIIAKEAEKIAAFVDWSQLVASSLRPGTERTWSNNWPPEPLLDQNTNFNSHLISLWEFLVLWTLTIFVVFLSYEYLFKKDPDEKLEPAIKITSLFKSQEKLLKYIPIVASLFVVQLSGRLLPSPHFIWPE